MISLTHTFIFLITQAFFFHYLLVTKGSPAKFTRKRGWFLPPLDAQLHAEVSLLLLRLVPSAFGGL